MQTVFSHIIRTRYSNSFEDVATDTLAYIINSHNTAQKGMMRLLRNITPDLPDLNFETQQPDGSARPDILGYSGMDKYVYIENKFWAGLTENQPVSYLSLLASFSQPSLLLMVVPVKREQSMLGELKQRMETAGLGYAEINSEYFSWCLKTEIGPWMALISWKRLIDILKFSTKGDAIAESDLDQLSSLCDAADLDEFISMSSEDLQDQRTPALILQLAEIIELTVKRAKEEGIISTKDLSVSKKDFQYYGQYAWLTKEHEVGVWYGVDLVKWKTYGRSPLWLVFATDMGHANAIKPLLEAYDRNFHRLIIRSDGYLLYPLTIDTGVDKDQVIRSILNQLREIAKALSTFKSPSEDIQD